MRINVKTSLLLLCIALTGVMFTGCNGSKKIEKPLDQNILGRWTVYVSYVQNDGQWVEDEFPGEAKQIMLFKEDGTAVVLYTEPEGLTTSRVVQWTADDKTEILQFGQSTMQVLGLSADELEISSDRALDPLTGEIVNGQNRWKLVRSDNDPKLLEEQLIGRWQFSHSYEMGPEGWVDATFGVVDAGYYEFRQDGTATSYCQIDNIEQKYDITWSSNTIDKTIIWTGLEEEPILFSVAIEDDTTLSVYFSNSRDIKTGEKLPGEYKDVFVRVVE